MKPVLVAILLAFVILEQASACCYPPKYHGYKEILEVNQFKYFEVDYDLGYIFETENVQGTKFRIFDLHNNRIYTIDGNHCTNTRLSFPELSARCMNPAHVDRAAGLTIGSPAHSLPVSTYKYEVYGLKVHKEVTPFGNHCVPVSRQTLMTRSTRTFTTMFYNIQEGANPAMFNHLTKCGVHPRGSTAPVEEHGHGEEEEEEEEEGEEEED